MLRIVVLIGVLSVFGFFCSRHFGYEMGHDAVNQVNELDKKPAVAAIGKLQPAESEFLNEAELIRGAEEKIRTEMEAAYCTTNCPPEEIEPAPNEAASPTETPSPSSVPSHDVQSPDVQNEELKVVD